MHLLGLGENQDIINENDNELIKISHEYMVHKLHESGRSIGQPKRHDRVLI
jgi:hypothetical protein